MALEDASHTLEISVSESSAQRTAYALHRLARIIPRLVWGAFLFSSLLATLFLTLWQSLPGTSHLEAWVSQQDAAHHVVYVPLSDISPVMVQALIAAEDEHFFQHHGVDITALLRAGWDDLRAGSLVEGGSTLTAQLAKNAYLGGQDHTIPLKIQDLMLALKIERSYSKSDILEMYLNLVYFGEGAYGIHAAALRYFDVSPAHLDLAQAALLAGLVQAPGYFDPWCHPYLAQDKQHAVLARMVADGYITSAKSGVAAHEVFSFWTPGIPQPSDAYCLA
jgi:membrane peptidoglycan carboxypeptidase